jgi:anti-anti-sigma factor
LDGEWDLTRRDELLALVVSLAPETPAVIDLRQCSYADSTVLGVLAGLRLKFGRVPITLLAPQPQVRRVLQIVNFDKLFTIAEDGDAPGGGQDQGSD